MNVSATLPEATVVPEAAPEVDPGPQLPFMHAPTGALFLALSEAQGEMSSAIRGSVNPHYKSHFADLDSVWEAIRQPLSRHGLCVIQVLLPSPRGTCLVTTLAHKSGEWIRSEVPVKPEKPGIHAIGSAITYMRRYALMAIAGVSPADDDGNEAARK